MVRALLLELKTGDGGPLFLSEAAAGFWTVHSWHGTLTAQAADVWVPQEVRSRAGRWRTKGDERTSAEEYIKTTRVAAFQVQHIVMTVALRMQGKVDVFDEAEVLRKLRAYMIDRGEEADLSEQHAQRFSFFGRMVPVGDLNRNEIEGVLEKIGG